jgi:hypothetical protein
MLVARRGNEPASRSALRATAVEASDDWDHPRPFGILDAQRSLRVPLREMGVRFAIDDVGAGYASLRHVVAMTPDLMKVDRTLVTNIDSDHMRRTLMGGSSPSRTKWEWESSQKVWRPRASSRRSENSGSLRARFQLRIPGSLPNTSGIGPGQPRHLGPAEPFGPLPMPGTVGRASDG